MAENKNRKKSPSATGQNEPLFLQTIVGGDDESQVEEWEYQLWDEYAAKFPEVKRLKGKKPFTGPGGLRRTLGEKSMEYFGRAYFPEYIPLPPPPFHVEWFVDLQRVAEGDGGNSIVRSAPRGHAKTTLWDFVFPTWAGVYRKKLYILIISDAYDQAQGFIANIKDELENNERILEDFGNLKGKVWQEGSIICSNGVKIEALGAGMKIRGRKNRARRPDLIILDDIENDENTATQEQRTKLKNWYTKAVRHAGAKYTDFVIIGTVIHEESLLAELLKTPGYNCRIYKAVIQFAENEELWAAWKDIFTDLNNERRTEDALAFFEQNRDEMLKGAKILWENGNPKFPRGYYDLMVLRVSDGEAAFASEMQNDPSSASDKFFRPHKYKYSELPPLNQLDVVMAIDPSMGQSDKSDYSAIIVLGTEKKTGQEYVLEADIKRRHPDVIITAMILHVENYQSQGVRIRTVGIEDVQFQAFFKSEAKRRAKERGLHLNIQPIRNTISKDLRIESMEPSINNGYVKIHENHTLLLQQLENYPRAKKDGPDALEMAIRIAQQGQKASKSVGAVMRRARVYG